MMRRQNIGGSMQGGGARFNAGSAGILGEYGGLQGMGNVASQQLLLGNQMAMMGNESSVDSMIQQHRLQQQLSLRESQLALANNLLQQQSQVIVEAGMNLGMPSGPGIMGSGPGMSNFSGMSLPQPKIPSLLDMPSQQYGKRRGEPYGSYENKRRRQNESSPGGNRGGQIRQNQRSDRNDRDGRNWNRSNSGSNVQRRQSSHDRDQSNRNRKGSRTDSGSASSTSAGRRQSRKTSEEYDPANPTEDDADEMAGLEIDPNACMDDSAEGNSSLTVTVGKKGRFVNKDGEPTGDTDTSQKSHFYCHACSMECYHEQNFQNHMKGGRHKKRMDTLLNLHKQKSSQIIGRMKAQEHLRSIEDKDKVGFCKLCDQYLDIPFARHRMLKVHKKRELQVRKGCGWCGVKDFLNFTEVLKHRETAKHMKNLEKFGHKKAEDMVTVDSIGFEESKSGAKRSNKPQSKLEPEEDDDDESGPEFNPETAVGKNYIIAVTGFFCRLCHKFYNNENAAKVTHCHSEAHFLKWKKARKQAKAAKAAKAAAASATTKPTSSDQANGDKSSENTAVKTEAEVGNEKNGDEEENEEEADVQKESQVEGEEEQDVTKGDEEKKESTQSNEGEDLAGKDEENAAEDSGMKDSDQEEEMEEDDVNEDELIAEDKDAENDILEDSEEEESMEFRTLYLEDGDQTNLNTSQSEDGEASKVDAKTANTTPVEVPEAQSKPVEVTEAQPEPVEVTEAQPEPVEVIEPQSKPVEVTEARSESVDGDSDGGDATPIETQSPVKGRGRGKAKRGRRGRK